MDLLGAGVFAARADAWAELLPAATARRQGRLFGRVESGHMLQSLPPAPSLDVGALSRLFKDTTNSYKYLFFLSLLEILKQRGFDVAEPITLHDLVVEMLVHAWYPFCYFHLSFGTQDKIADKLRQLDLQEPIRMTDPDRSALRAALKARLALHPLAQDLWRYVTFRLIRVFFAQDLAGKKDSQVDKMILGMSTQDFDTRRPLYRIHESVKSLVVHPEWAAYFKSHYVIVRSWAAWEWLCYMQGRNPNVPAVAAKLFPPAERRPLKAQTEYWKTVLSRQPLHCPYSGTPLDPRDFSLDHFVPWSFVCHDRLWNLVPVPGRVNSAKGDNLPSHDYLDAFVELQFRGLAAAHDAMEPGRWTVAMEPYVADLRVPLGDLLDLDVVRKAYRDTLPPLLSLASTQGFASDWRYHTETS